MRDVVIIGAGPAGLNAALTCAADGVTVTVLDEYIHLGGRLLGQLYEEPDGSWWNGMKEAENLFKKINELNIEIKLGYSVHSIEQKQGEWLVETNHGGYRATCVLLATGAAEAPNPVKGWTLPGVMSVGAAQVMTNVQRVKPGKRGIIIGVSILGSAIAMELDIAGVDISAMVLPEKNQINTSSSSPLEVIDSLQHIAHMAPSKLIKQASPLLKMKAFRHFAIKAYPKRGVKMWGIPIQLRKAALEIYGENQVEGVKVATVDIHGNIVGKIEDIKVDFVCIAGGLYPLAELAGVAGCPFYWIEELGGHVPLHSEKMETTLDGLFVAGNITGIESAKVALIQGEIAGLSIIHAIHGGKDTEVKSKLEYLKHERAQAGIKFNPNVELGRAKMTELWNDYYSALDQKDFSVV